jgi:hypothetical protein
MHQNWDKASYNILTNSGLEKLTQSWEKTPETFDVYFVKKDGMGQIGFEIGQVDENYLKEKMKINVPINRNNITAIFANNKGQERMPMTSWTTAHRFGHAIRQLASYQKYFAVVQRDFKVLLKQIYGKNEPSGFDRKYNLLLKQIMSAFGSMRSARTNSLVNYGEFAHELFAEYITTGKIIFRTEIPKQLTTSYAWGKPNDGAYSQIHNDELMMNSIKDMLPSMADHYVMLCEDILVECVGKIFVM